MNEEKLKSIAEEMTTEDVAKLLFSRIDREMDCELWLELGIWLEDFEAKTKRKGADELSETAKWFEAIRNS